MKPSHRSRYFLPLLLIVLLLSVNVVFAQPTPEFFESDCPFDVPADQNIECGYLSVPEDRDEADSPTINLAVMLIRSPNDNPEPDPIVYLEGGPGGSALLGFESWLNTPFGENRDIILIDQRGTGFSEPFLGCMIDDEDLDPVDFAIACRDDLEGQGVNLTAYTSRENAADIADLREVLGYDEINLYGVSYGTRLALTIMRDHPEGIRSVVLDSSFPPNADGNVEQATHFYAALTQMFTDCANDAGCNAAYPDLESILFDLVDEMNANPLDLDGEDFYGDDLLNTLFQSLYNTAVLRYLPAVIGDTANGDTGFLLALLNDELGYDETEAMDESFDDDSIDDELLDFDDLTEAQLNTIFLFNELWMVYEGFDDEDAFFDYLDTLDADEYYALAEAFVFDGLTDEDFDTLFMTYFEYGDLDVLYEAYDTMSDEEFEGMADAIVSFLVYGEMDGGAMGDGDDGEFIDFEALGDSVGMYNSVSCYEEYPFSSVEGAVTFGADLPAQIQDVVISQLDTEFAVCDVWAADPPDPIEAEAVVSDIPTLVLAGNYDPITPPAWGQLAADTLSNSYFYVFPGVGHGVIDGGECPVSIGVAFIDAPQNEPDASCIQTMDAPDFES